MLKKIALTTALIASFGTAHAYQAEIGGTIAVVDPDHGDTSAGFALDGTYYFMLDLSILFQILIFT